MANARLSRTQKEIFHSSHSCWICIENQLNFVCLSPSLSLYRLYISTSISPQTAATSPIASPCGNPLWRSSHESARVSVMLLPVYVWIAGKLVILHARPVRNGDMFRVGVIYTIKWLQLPLICTSLNLVISLIPSSCLFASAQPSRPAMAG